MSQSDSVQQLLSGLRSGMVPHQVRLFAAQGLLPVSREDLIRLQLLLTTDAAEEVAEQATTSLREEEATTLCSWVRSAELDSLELDLLVRVRDEEPIWEAVSQHRLVSDETLRLLARHGSPLIQDIIMTNQVRMLGCLELLEELRQNPRVTHVILRRVHEFEEEFIEKAAKAAQREEALLDVVGPGPSVRQALDALLAIGARLPAEDTMPRPRNPDAELIDEADANDQGAYAKLLKMTVPEKIIAALKGSREERSILVNSRNHLVARAVLASPKLTDNEIEKIAASKSVSDEVVRGIATNPKWLRKYSIVYLLAQNPKTPLRTAIGFINRLNRKDVERLARNRNVHPEVRKHAHRMLERRR